MPVLLFREKNVLDRLHEVAVFARDPVRACKADCELVRPQRLLGFMQMLELHGQVEVRDEHQLRRPPWTTTFPAFVFPHPLEERKRRLCMLGRCCMAMQLREHCTEIQMRQRNRIRLLDVAA